MMQMMDVEIYMMMDVKTFDKHIHHLNRLEGVVQ